MWTVGLVATCNKAAWLQPAIKQHMVAACNKAALLQPAFKQHARWHRAAEPSETNGRGRQE
jgi:hypothetical protein